MSAYPANGHADPARQTLQAAEVGARAGQMGYHTCAMGDAAGISRQGGDAKGEVRNV